ncbi:Myb/SANT-like DNA-binding domain-containing protein [Ilyonectria robusta]|uniref:Myb/SANT-like DNA-binding domain-containing protein n=1 Tax=Ilyonectria robusta TaxID=1079257 RepID=UPI001E8D5828|nr:Myb/SANT-like DNA-binding domain-containing protein [Ilyonectria robusta]KAH6989127.1 Myb/SANT-like DNA-binding domain-containing protein [Ilyonectria sp. MPI-CAGE-AT-0026]KAH8688355.1 Myb/SANT-like DNA-binding domain-containing protein [Ilyonectria robusta]
MSEDDGDVLGPDGQATAARVDRDRRAPRFSWTPAYEATFFRSLCESVQLGLRENSSFKAEAWERAAQALQESHGAYPTKSHLINKSDNARKRFRLWRGLREDPEFLYNPVTRTVTATEEAWTAHIEREPLSRALRGRPFDHEDYMEILYPDVIGSGGAPKRIMKPRRRTDGPIPEDSEMPGTSILNLQSEPPPRPPGLESPNQRPTVIQPTATPSTANGATQRPTSTSIPPRAPTASSSALTPPDETITQNRKRQLPTTSTPSAFESTPPSSTGPMIQQPPESPEKRRRTSSNDGSRAIASAATLNSSMLPLVISNGPSVSSPSQGEGQALPHPPLFEELVEAVKSRTSLRWQEEALDVFFRDFADEDLDLQVKISESVLVNESKAMVFCKMPSRVRQHWVRRFREPHHRAG